MRALRNHLWLVAVLTVVLLTWWLETAAPFNIKPRAPQGKPKAVRAYEELEDAQLVEHRDNDGDSFIVRHAGGEHTFRLHFVDAPEKRVHQYNGDRLRHQAEYFGGLETPQILRIGQMARDYTLNALSTRPFTVATRWREVYDSGRYYAFVSFDDGGELMEELVEQGLVRIYTEGAPHPDGRSEARYRALLKELEKRSRQANRGAWGGE